MSSYMKFNSCGGVKTPWCFLENYSMISTDALQVGFLSSLTIVNEGVVVNEGSSLTIVNKTIKKRSLWKTFILKNVIFKKRSFRFRFFRRRFHNGTIVFLKNENVPSCDAMSCADVKFVRGYCCIKNIWSLNHMSNMRVNV